MRTIEKGFALALLACVAVAPHGATAAPLGLGGGAAGLSASSALPVQEVGGRYHGRRYRGGWDNGNTAAAAATAGIIGLATGAIIGGALANQNRCYGNCYGYAAPPVRVYEAPPVVYEAPPVYAAPVYAQPRVYAAPPVYVEPAPYGGPVYVVPRPYDGPATDPSGCYDVGARVVCPY